MNQEQEYRFPNNFIWGASTAAHQIEGNNVDSDWWRVSMPKTQTFMNHQETRRTVTTGTRRIFES